MDRNECARLIEALKKGTVTVTFQKIDSDEIRVMPCSLNPTVLEANGITVTVRRSRGKDIDAACGQLANKS